MRKRSIEELCRALAYTRPEPGPATDPVTYRVALAQWRRDVKAAADAAAERNVGFSYPRFYAMCGLNEVDNEQHNHI